MVMVCKDVLSCTLLSKVVWFTNFLLDFIANWVVIVSDIFILVWKSKAVERLLVVLIIVWFVKEEV